MRPPRRLASIGRSAALRSQAAAVGDHRDAGVQQADEGADVLGFPGLFEVPDDAGLSGRGGRGKLSLTKGKAHIIHQGRYVAFRRQLGVLLTWQATCDGQAA